MPLSRDEIRIRVGALGPWFHNMDLGGVRTAPEHFLCDYPNTKWSRFADAVPQHLIHDTVADDLLLFQTMQRGSDKVKSVKPDYGFFKTKHFDKAGYPKMHFIEHSYAGAPPNWWAPSAARAQAMLRSSGFEIVEHAEAEVYLCRRVAPAGEPRAVSPAKPEPNGADGP